MFTLFILMFLCFGCFGGYVHNENIIDEHINQQQVKNLSHDSYGTTYVTQTEFLDLYPCWVQLFTNMWGADNPFVYGFAYSNQTQGWSHTINVTEWRYQFYLSQIEDVYNNRDIKYQIKSIEFSASRVANEFFQTKRITLTFSLSSGGTFTRLFLYHIYDRSDSINTLVDGEMVGAIYYTFIDGETYAQIMNECLLFPINSDMANIISLYQGAPYLDGYNTGYAQGYDSGLSNGYQQGYSTALNELSSQDSTALTIFTGILNIALLPVNVFLGIFNFEIFGINLAGFISSILTITIIIIIIRFLLGGKSNDK